MTQDHIIPGRRTLLGSAACAAFLGLHGIARASGEPEAIYADTFPDLDGREVGMQTFLGKPLVLNFWATWCPPCVKEMPDLDALHQAHPQVGFLGLAVDTEVNVRRFVQKVQVAYPLLISGHGGIKLMRALGNRQGGLPFTVVFDEKGKVKHRILGQIKPDALEDMIRGLAV